MDGRDVGTKVLWDADLEPGLGISEGLYLVLIEVQVLDAQIQKGNCGVIWAWWRYLLWAVDGAQTEALKVWSLWR